MTSQALRNLVDGRKMRDGDKDTVHYLSGSSNDAVSLRTQISLQISRDVNRGVVDE